jgi:uncharacterized repeat protein (TIGR02543 family)
MMKKGASLVWVLIMSLALMFIAVTTANFVIKESQFGVRMDDSARAYAAAESGIEWGKYCMATPTCYPDNSLHSYGPYNISGSTYSVTINGIKLESTGTSNGVNRKLEYLVQPGTALDKVKDADLTMTTFSIAGSYVQQFDYWTDGDGTAQIGLGTADGKNAIYFDHFSEAGNQKIRLAAKSDSLAIPKYSSSASDISIDSTDVQDLDSAYALRVRIEYFQDLSVKMTVSRQVFGANPGFICESAPLVIDLRGTGVNPATFKNFYYSHTPTANAIVGDQSVMQISDGSNISYFDNMSTFGINYGSVSNTLTAFFDSNGGTNLPAVTGLTAGAKLTKPTDPEKPGQLFAGWYKDAAFGTKWDFPNDTVTVNNTILYAKWILSNPITVTYVVNGGTNIANNPYPTVPLVYLTAPIITKGGNTFLGWYRDVAMTQTWDFANDQVMGDMSLYAKWTPITKTGVGTTLITIKWIPLPSIDTQRVYISTSPSGPWTLKTEVPAANTAANLTGLTRGTSYWVTIAPVTGGVEGAQYFPANFSTLP